MKALHKHRPTASASALPSTTAVRNPAALPVASEQGNGHGQLPPAPPTSTAQARYDSDKRFDSGVRYVLGTADTTPSAPVAKVKMDLKGRTDEDFDFFVGNHIALITGNADFTDQQPLPADLLAAYTLYETKLVALQQIRDLAKQATTEKDQARKALTDLMIIRGAYVQLASEGNAAKILGVGLGVVSPRTPTGPLMPPTNLRSYLGEVPGVMELRWDGVEGGRGYLVQCSPDVMPRQFSQIKNCGRTSLKLENLTVGDTLVFRVATQGGSTGQSPWSAELIRTIG